MAAQVVGGLVALGVILVLYPRLSPEEAGDILVPHADRIEEPSGLPT